MPVRVALQLPGEASSWQLAMRSRPLEHAEIEKIARVILREYGLPLKFREVMIGTAGRCTVGFSDSYSGAATVSVGIWCDAKVSPHRVRESLKRGLQVAD